MEGQVKRASALFLLAVSAACGRPDDVIIVGSKNFTESIILGEIVAQQIEGLGITVERKLNLGGTFINHEAITAGQLDVYVEYTGTAYSAVLRLPVIGDPEAIQDAVDSAYAKNWDLVWAPQFGFNNTFAMLIRGEDARRLGLTTLSEAVAHTAGWTAGFGHEFLNRADGFEGLTDRYGMEFSGSTVSMDLGLIYRALAAGQIDITAGNSTDGQIQALDLFHLEDDLRYFPPYRAAPLIRAAVLDRFPEITVALAALEETIDETLMARMNFLVDVERQSPREVAAGFLSRLEQGI